MGEGEISSSPSPQSRLSENILSVILKEVQISSGRLKNPYFIPGERILRYAQNDILGQPRNPVFIFTPDYAGCCLFLHKLSGGPVGIERPIIKTDGATVGLEVKLAKLPPPPCCLAVERNFSIS